MAMDSLKSNNFLQTITNIHNYDKYKNTLTINNRRKRL